MATNTSILITVVGLAALLLADEYAAKAHAAQVAVDVTTARARHL
jgi:hypothetical protein